MMPGRTWRTLRHLRPSQVLHRLWYRGRVPLFRLTVRSGDEVGGPVLTPAAWAGDGLAGARIAATGAIRLVGIEGQADDWAAADKPLLWRFTLHYFEWLADLAALGVDGGAAARRLVDGWLTRFERFDAVAWHPYPLSLRLYSWLSFANFLEDGAEPGFVDRFRRSLHAQARHLERVWERDVGGNHLIKNLKADIAAALCLPGHAHRLAPALRRLEAEIARQILADGCHYERSPSYHLQVMGDFADLAALFGRAGLAVPPALAGALDAMGPAAEFFRMGSGLLAQFNDGTSEAPPPGTVIPPAALPEAGYWRLEAGGAVVVIDCGPCCPDDLPAHAHADTLSFEFSAGSCPLVVNRGTYAYQDARWRNVFRGTASHSTVAIDDGDSAEVYGGFRLGRRPRRFEVRAEGRHFDGAFDGWARLGLWHRRRLSLEEGRLEGCDIISGGGMPHRATVWFHLHPSVAARPDGRAIRLDLADGSSWRFTASVAATLEPGRWSPGFHEMVDATSIRVDSALGAGDLVIDWSFEKA